MLFLYTMNGFALQTLQLHQLRHTNCREDTLVIFQDKEGALSHGDLENALQNRYDRVTIYRTLKTFTDKGILHKVLDEDGLRYALCKEACSTHLHHHDHVHFKCNSCGKTICLDDVHIPKLLLPNGFRGQEVGVLIQGKCPQC
jgi:Fur family transcriptional regulator, ferric uptake regulator